MRSRDEILDNIHRIDPRNSVYAIAEQLENIAELLVDIRDILNEPNHRETVLAVAGLGGGDNKCCKR